MKCVLLWLLVSTSIANVCIAGIHGLGDDCESFKNTIEKTINSQPFRSAFGEEVKGLCLNQFSKGESRKRSMEDQAEQAYKNLESSGCRNVYLIALSQGALIGSYIIGRHDKSRMRIRGFTTIGGINRGIHSIHGKIMNQGMRLLYSIWPDYYKVLKDYLRDYSVGILNPKTDFLENAINEKDPIEKELKQRFLSLDKIVLIGYSKEDFIKPHQTAYFLWGDKKGGLTPFNEDEFFQEDKLGILEQFAKGKLQPFEMEGGHGEINNLVIIKAFLAMREENQFNREKLEDLRSLEDIFAYYVEKVELKEGIEEFWPISDTVAFINLPKRIKKIFISLNSPQGIYANSNYSNLRFPPVQAEMRSRDSSIVERLNRHFKRDFADPGLDKLVKQRDKKKVLLGSGQVNKPQFPVEKKVSNKPKTVIDLKNRKFVSNSGKTKQKTHSKKLSAGFASIIGKQTFEGPISKLSVERKRPKTRIRKAIDLSYRRPFK